MEPSNEAVRAMIDRAMESTGRQVSVVGKARARDAIALGLALLEARARIAELEAEVYRTSAGKAAFDEAAG